MKWRAEPLPPLSDIGGLYAIANKKATLFLWRTNTDGTKKHEQVRNNIKNPILLLSFEERPRLKDPSFSEREYKFLWNGYVWSHVVYSNLDSIPLWLKPISCFYRYNPNKIRKPRNLGTKYPGKKMDKNDV